MSEEINVNEVNEDEIEAFRADVKMADWDERRKSGKLTEEEKSKLEYFESLGCVFPD
ncbi:MAG: hypothetical protein II625_02235 [Bacilli bacterium]|nr:hypothetical protein [Bacilli bacterium]